MSVEVMVGVRYTAPTGGSEMLTKLIEYGVAPAYGDEIELVPEIKNSERHTSEWHATVLQRWLHTSAAYGIEVHVRLGADYPRRTAPEYRDDEEGQARFERDVADHKQALADLREAGFS